MQRKKLFACLAFLWIVVSATLAHADSDGYYCTAKGYLAYELREGLGAAVKGHVLWVVMFGPSRGIYATGEITLQDFQVHSLTCNPTSVEISGWDRGFVRYSVEISPAGVRISDHTEDAKRVFDYRKDPPEPPNLGRFAPSAPVRLESSDPDHEYELVATRDTKPVQGQEQTVDTHFHSDLVQTDLAGKVLQRFTLFDLHDVAGDSGD